MKKRLLSMILALGMMLTILPVNAITAWAENEKIIKSGNCGTGGSDNVTYVLTQNNDDNTNKTYTLTISGNGKMNNYSDYSYNYAPWNSVNYAITQVVFEGDITTIGNYSFYRCTRLTSITIPNSVISIGTGAFLDCTGLKEITMPDDSNFKLHSIGAYAFEDCRSLKSITIPSSVQSIGEHAFYESFGSLKVYWPTVLSDHITVDDELGYNATYYYPGYKSAWDVQKSKISNLQGLNSVRYYCDVTIDANGGTFSDGTKTKVVKKVWSKENLTQEQVKVIGVPKNAQKAFFGWKYNPFYITENLENVVIEDSMTFCADYSGNTVTLGQLNNGNELVKGNSYEFTVTINTYCDDSGSPIKKLTFGDVAGTIKYKNSKIEGAEGLDITLPDGGKEKTLTFTFTPNEVGQNQTLTAYLDGLKYKEEEYGPVTSDITYSVRDRQNAEVTITGLDNTTVKAGEAKEFTVNATPNDDANTGAKATITVSGANADAVEKIQYKDGGTWNDVPDEGLSIDKINNTEFKLITKADANDGDVTITVTAKKANDTEIDKKVAAVTVKKHENAAVTIDGLDGTTVKAGEAKDFTVNVTPNDDANTGAKATITVSGANANAVEKIQYKDGETWKDVPGEGLSIDKINNTEFKLITKAGANDGDVTITVTAKKADGTEIDKKVAAVTVKKHENAAVTITGLDGTTVKAGEVQDFTVSVTPNDDTINKVTFVTTSGEVQWSSDNGNTWTTVSGDVDYSELTGKKFRVVPAADAENGNVTVTVTAKKADGTEIAKTASFTVTAREHATVKINELNGKTIKQNKAHTFTVTVTAHDDGGETTLKFDNVAGLTYNGTAVTDAGVTVTLTKNQSETLNFTLTPSETGSKTLTATLSTSGATDTATYTVSEYEHAKVTIDGLGTDLKQGESKDFTVKVDPKDDSGNAIIDFGDKNSEIQYKDGEDWKSMPSGGLKINLSNGEKPYDFRITPKNDGSQTLTATVKQNDNELDRVEQTYTVAKKDEPTTPGGGENPGENPGGGSTGGSENPGENPGGGSTGDSGNTKPTPKPDEKPDRKIKIDGGIVEVNGKEVKPDEDGNITVKKGDEITVTVDKSKISDAQVFDQWVIKPDSVLNEVDPKSEKISFTMPAEDVTIEAMTRDASIEDDGPGVLGTGALIATGVVGSAALLYQGHMLGTELYLRYLLPHGAVIPQNRAELAVLLWQDAENPEPVSTTLYSDISDEDSAIQQAARWAVENDLMEQLDAEEHPDHFDPFVPVTFSDSIRAWKKAQELKKSVH